MTLTEFRNMGIQRGEWEGDSCGGIPVPDDVQEDVLEALAYLKRVGCVELDPVEIALDAPSAGQIHR